MTSRIYLKRELANLGVTEGDMKRLKRRRSDKAYEKVARLAIRRLGYYFPTRPLLEYDNEEEKDDDDKDMEESDDLQECIRDPAILAIDTAPETADSVERLAQETLRTIAGRLDNAQRLELAGGGPLTFLGREVQLIDVNADEEISCKPIPTKIESDEIKTLINWAVEVGTTRENVREIVNAYKTQSTQSLDEIWRTLYPSTKPPLHVAIECGHAGLVEELLIAGVDPAVRYSDSDSSPCLFSGIAHHECKGSISGEPSLPPCNDALRLGIACARAQRDRASPNKPSSAEDCVLALLNHGAEIDVFESAIDDTAPFSREFSELLALGLARAIHTTVDRIFALAAAHPKRTQLARRLDEVLGRALECLDPPTGEEALIRRLADLGASAAPSVVPAPRYRRLLETALGAAGSGGFQSAVAGLFAGPRASELRHCDDVAASVAQLRLEDAHIGFTWALFAALRDLETVAAASGGGGGGGRADAFVGDPELTSRELQGRLLARAIDCEALDTVRWLLAQDCPMYEESDHPLLYAIRNNRLKVARGLLEDNSVGSEDVNVDQMLNDRTLLEEATEAGAKDVAK